MSRAGRVLWMCAVAGCSQSSGNGTIDAPASVDTPSDPTAACKLPGPKLGVGVGFPRIAGRSKSVGPVRVGVVFVDFSDAVATRTPEDAFSLISPGAEDYYAAVSYQRMTLAFDTYPVWLRMSKPTSGYHWSTLTFASHKAYIQEALDLAGANLDFSHDDAVLVVSNPDSTAFTFGPAFVANPGEGVTASGKVFDNGVTSGGDLIGWGPHWFDHEFGHTMTLADLYDFAMPANPQTFHFIGDFSIMGNIAGKGGEYLGWERWLLGWLDDDQVTCAAHGHTAVVLSPIETPGGHKLIVVPTGANAAVVVESRRALGFDTELPNEGLLVYTVAPSLGTGNGVVQVLPANDADLQKLAAPLAPSTSLTAEGVTVTFTSLDADGAHVDISY